MIIYRDFKQQRDEIFNKAMETLFSINKRTTSTASTDLPQHALASPRQKQLLFLPDSQDLHQRANESQNCHRCVPNHQPEWDRLLELVTIGRQFARCLINWEPQQRLIKHCFTQELRYYLCFQKGVKYSSKIRHQLLGPLPAAAYEQPEWLRKERET